MQMKSDGWKIFPLFSRGAMGCRNDLTPQPPSLVGKGETESAPLPASGRGWGRGHFRDGYAETLTKRQGYRADELRNCGQGILLGESPCCVVENGSCLDSFLYGNFR
jgi:hypothetical protein